MTNASPEEIAKERADALGLLKAEADSMKRAARRLRLCGDVTIVVEALADALVVECGRIEADERRKR